MNLKHKPIFTFRDFDQIKDQLIQLTSFELTAY